MYTHTLTGGSGVALASCCIIAGPLEHPLLVVQLLDLLAKLSERAL